MLITLRFLSVVQSSAMQQANCRLRMNERNFHAQSHCVSLSVQFPLQRTKLLLPYFFAYIRRNNFFGNPVCYLVRNHFIYVNNFFYVEV